MTNTYLFDPEDGTEMARLIHLDRVMTKGMGGTLTGLPPLPETAQVLDLCCGPGGWVLDLAYEHPEMEIIGMDLSRTMIQYAQARAETQHLTNAAFVVGNILEPWGFPDHSFDLVNARFLIATLPRASWPEVLRACYQVTKPSGVIRLTESDFLGLTSSRAFADFSQMIYRVSHAHGYGFSPDQCSLGITHMLGGFLHAVGCEQIQSAMHVVDFSADTDAWADLFRNYEIAFHAIQPLLLQAGSATQEELDSLYQQFLIEIHLDSFRGLWPSMSIWGTKPLVEREVKRSHERTSG